MHSSGIQPLLVRASNFELYNYGTHCISTDCSLTKESYLTPPLNEPLTHYPTPLPQALLLQFVYHTAATPSAGSQELELRNVDVGSVAWVIISDNGIEGANRLEDLFWRMVDWVLNWGFV